MALLRGVDMLPVGANLPVAGSYSSAVARTCWPLWPPAIRTRPSARAVAVWPVRPAFACGSGLTGLEGMVGAAEVDTSVGLGSALAT